MLLVLGGSNKTLRGLLAYMLKVESASQNQKASPSL